MSGFIVEVALENIACGRSGRLGASLTPLPRKEEEDLLRLPPQKPSKPSKPSQAEMPQQLERPKKPQQEGKTLPPPSLKPKRTAPPLPAKQTPPESLSMKPAKPMKPMKPIMPMKPMKPTTRAPPSEEVDAFAW